MLLDMLLSPLGKLLMMPLLMLAFMSIELLVLLTLHNKLAFLLMLSMILLILMDQHNHLLQQNQLDQLHILILVFCYMVLKLLLLMPNFVASLIEFQ